jgi:hypothetical protein
MKRLITASVVIAALFTLGNAEAKSVRTIYGKVTDIIATDGAIYGGCAVKVNYDIRKYSSSCSGAATGSWVTFSCSGQLQDAETGKFLFEQAQIAYLMNKTIRFDVEDSKKHNNFCLVTRTDMK